MFSGMWNTFHVLKSVKLILVDIEYTLTFLNSSISSRMRERGDNLFFCTNSLFLKYPLSVPSTLGLSLMSWRVEEFQHHCPSTIDFIFSKLSQDSFVLPSIHAPIRFKKTTTLVFLSLVSVFYDWCIRFIFCCWLFATSGSIWECIVYPSFKIYFIIYRLYVIAFSIFTES